MIKNLSKRMHFFGGTRRTFDDLLHLTWPRLTFLSAFVAILKFYQNSVTELPHVKTDILVFSGSKNQEKIGKLVQSHLLGNWTISHWSLEESPWGTRKCFYKSLVRFLLTLPVYSIHILIRCPRHIFFVDKYYESIFFNYVADEVITSKIQWVIFTNDHNAANLSLKNKCKALGVKTAYFQHGNISSCFPVLDYKLAFLDGKHSEEIYSEIGDSETKIHLTGRLIEEDDCYCPSNSRSFIGISVGQEDCLKTVQELAIRLSATYRVRIRFHPSFRTETVTNILSKSLNQYDIQISDTERETASDFLRSCYMIIANRSGISFEGVLLGCVAINLNSSKKSNVEDYYYFEKSCLVHTVRNVEEIERIISEERLSEISNRQRNVLKDFDHLYHLDLKSRFVEQKKIITEALRKYE